MDGLRELATAEVSSELKFLAKKEFKYPTICIEHRPDGQSEFKESLRRPEQLRTFFQTGRNDTHSFKMAYIPMPGKKKVSADQGTFSALLRDMQLDAWVEHMICNEHYGFFYSGLASLNDHDKRLGDDDSAPHVASHFLGTTSKFVAWTCRWQPSTGRFVTKCLVLEDANENEWKSRMESDLELPNYARLFKQNADSVFFMPLLAAVQTLRWRKRRLMQNLGHIRGIESRTGHGSWGNGGFQMKRDSIPELTASLGAQLNSVTHTSKQLGALDAVLDYIIKGVEGSSINNTSHSSSSTRPTQDGRQDEHDPAPPGLGSVSDKSILEAARILEQECKASDELAHALEVRIRSQSSVLFAFLTHEDSKINIEVANASKDLAEAARRDASSMKTVAVLTMAFLPATFLAALFSIPSLGWDERKPEKFAIYWACVVPVTIVTFALWAGFTQRGEVVETVKAVKMLLEHRKRRERVGGLGDVEVGGQRGAVSITRSNVLGPARRSSI